jgi:hypothetical protein
VASPDRDGPAYTAARRGVLPIKKKDADIPEPIDVLAIVEDWCPDVVANLPIIARIAHRELERANLVAEIRALAVNDRSKAAL